MYTHEEKPLMLHPHPVRRLSRATLGALLTAVLVVAAATPAMAAERHTSEATGLAFDVPDGWQEVTHGAPEDDGHDRDEEEEPHAEAIPHHALGNYPGIADGEPPAAGDEALIELGALPNSFLCDATLDSATGPIEATYAYFGSQAELPPAPAAYTLTIGDGIAASGMDLTFGELAAVWIAWPAGGDVTAWAFVGSVGSSEPHEALAWEVAASLEVEVTADEMATMFADFAPDDPCAAIPDTAMAAVDGPGSMPPLSLMGLAALTLAGLIARERIRQAELRARRRREARGEP